MLRSSLVMAMSFALGIAGGVLGSKLLAPVGDHPAVNAPVQILAPTGGADGIADLVDKVKRAVVNIDTVAHQRVQAPEDIFRFFFGEGGGPPAMREAKGVGSGFLIRPDGLVVTNFHVVRGAEKLTVTLENGNKYPGKVVGTDPSTDLALVKIAAKDAPSLKLADPKTLRVGQYVVAVGSPLGLQQTVTMGILSAINRSIGLNVHVSFIQTDAPINPGNSGGPLLNLKGEVIGVNTAIAAQGQGIGFAIPVDILQGEVPQLEAHGQVQHAWLGVALANLPEDRSQMFYPTDTGVLVGRVEPNSPAAKAGIQAGDVLLEFNHKKLTDSAQLVQEVSKLPVGSKVDLLVSRKGQQKSFSLTLDKMPRDYGNQPDQDQDQ
jgi:S1-C subfamily serine protease